MVVQPGAWIEVGQSPRHGYTETEAKTALLGYAFGTRAVVWTPTPHVPLIWAPTGVQQYLWAYAAYDCVPSSPHGMTVQDVVVTAGLNSRIDAGDVLAVIAVAGDLSYYLSQIPSEQTFWTLPRTQLVTFQNGTAPATWLWRAWRLLQGFNGIDVAISHKVLHHKRPWFFPLLDGKTVSAYPSKQAWVGIHDDLVAQEQQFDELERWFAVEAVKRGGVALTRLRIHDILLWSMQTDKVAKLLAAGAAIGAHTPPQRMSL
jgi:hypothetical protein